MKIVSISAFLAIMVAFAFLAQSAAAEPTIVEEVHEAPVEEVVGGDKDEHGCVATAGYLWSEEKQACTRPWEEDGTEVIEHDASNGEKVIAPKPIRPTPDNTNAETATVETGDYDHSELIGIEPPISPKPVDSQTQQNHEFVILSNQTPNWFEQLLQALVSWLL